MFNVILFRPEIPPNTGNIIRLSANTGCVLHLVRPLGFLVDARTVRRAGLDYDEFAQVKIHVNLEACLDELKGARIFSVETSGSRIYSDAHFEPNDTFLFGSERRGLPPEVLHQIPADRQLTIPMRAGNRSLNLSNSVALVIYEAWRQNSFRR